MSMTPSVSFLPSSLLVSYPNKYILFPSAFLLRLEDSNVSVMLLFVVVVVVVVGKMMNTHLY